MMLAEDAMPKGSFDGLRVLSLESRRAEELARLITTYGGQPIVAPAMREVPLESNREALEFAAALLKGEFEIVIFLTGVGTRALAAAVESICPKEKFAAALGRVTVVARGPKPVAALKELGVTPNIVVPEPNTWREMLQELDREPGRQAMSGLRVAVQEYGVPNPELIAGLEERGARVTRVPVYKWALPENTAPLREAVRAVAGNQIDVVFFTTSVQSTHLFQMAAEMAMEGPLRRGLERCVIASIGPTTTEELHRRGLSPDMEPSHPKMGYLVKEASERSAELLRAKRGSVTS
jgi:uroporphyrinogen-III synthase